MKQLKERVQELEKQEKKNGVEKVIVIKKPDLRGNEDTTNSGDIITTSSDHDDCSTILPEIAARALGKEVLIEIHCEKENGTELKILDHLENLHLSVNGSSVLPFGNSALSVTVIAQVNTHITYMHQHNFFLVLKFPCIFIYFNFKAEAWHVHAVSHILRSGILDSLTY